MTTNRTALHPNELIRREFGPCHHPGCNRRIYTTARADDASAPLLVSCSAGHIWPPHPRYGS